MRILYLDLDTTRPDHLGCYGYHRNTSPNIDRIASEGIRYDNYYCSDAPCLPSRTALTTGMFGIHTGVVGHGGSQADIRTEGRFRGFRDRLWNESLAGVLRSAGMRTTVISPFAERHSSWNFYAGFTEMHNTGKGGGESAEEITPTVLDWIERNGKSDDWFLHVNYWDPHNPYRAPEEFGNPFADEPLPDWISPELLDEHWQLTGPHTAQDYGMYNNNTVAKYPRAPGEVHGIDGFRRVTDGYDCGIRYMDTHIGRLLDAFDGQDVLDDLVIIVSADHGENFGELGIYGEHGTADAITCRIPMIVRWPGKGTAGSADTGLRYNLDLVPTMAEILGVSSSDRWDGTSFAASIHGKVDSGHEHLVISQCAHVAQRSVLFDDWLYMRTYHDGFHPHFGEHMLYNLADDPHETTDLASRRSAELNRGIALLDGWHDTMMRTMPFPDTRDPLFAMLHERGPFHAWVDQIVSNDYLNRLRLTGREAGLAELLEGHPELSQFDDG